MLYFLQVNVYAALLFGVYLLFLKNRTNYSYSRLYLLACAVLPFIMPFLILPGTYGAVGSGALAARVTLPAVVISRQATAFSDRMVYPGYVYWLVSALLVARFVIQYARLQLFIRKQPHEPYLDFCIIKNSGFGPGSWGKYIFFPGDETDAAVLEHEVAHATLKHSRDILLLRLVQCFFWPDIVLLLVAAELKILHEFQADARAAQDEHHYIQTLFNQIFHTRQFSLSHTFSQNPIKRRVMMLQKRSTSKVPVTISLIAAIGIMAAIICIQSCNKQGNDQAPTKEALTNVLSSELKGMKFTGDSGRIDTKYLKGTFQAVTNNADKMPVPNFNVQEYMEQKLIYPADARLRNAQGRVIVQFIVDENGNIVMPEIVRSPDSSLSMEALSVISKMPKWTPGEKNGKKVAVQYNLPVLFQMQ